MTSPCDSLPAGFREICEGTSGHSPQKRHNYMMLFTAQGLLTHLPNGYEPPAQGTVRTGRRKTTPRTIDDLPCPYRGKFAGILPCKPCTSGGKSGADSWECSLHTLCTFHNVTPTDRHRPTACLTCSDRPGATD